MQRPDDAEPIVRERLRVYREQTAPLIDHYRKKGWLFEVNGERTPDTVYQEIISHLNNN